MESANKTIHLDDANHGLYHRSFCSWLSPGRNLESTCRGRDGVVMCPGSGNQLFIESGLLITRKISVSQLPESSRFANHCWSLEHFSLSVARRWWPTLTPHLPSRTYLLVWSHHSPSPSPRHRRDRKLPARTRDFVQVTAALTSECEITVIIGFWIWIQQFCCLGGRPCTSIRNGSCQQEQLPSTTQEIEDILVVHTNCPSVPLHSALPLPRPTPFLDVQ